MKWIKKNKTKNRRDNEKNMKICKLFYGLFYITKSILYCRARYTYIFIPIYSSFLPIKLFFCSSKNSVFPINFIFFFLCVSYNCPSSLGFVIIIIILFCICFFFLFFLVQILSSRKSLLMTSTDDLERINPFLVLSLFL